jgi:RNA polymerase sigma factor (sigma-70 family)
MERRNYDSSPSWSPDGTLLAFVGEIGGPGKDDAAGAVCVMRADGSHVTTPVTNGGEEEQAPSWGTAHITGRYERAWRRPRRRPVFKCPVPEASITRRSAPSRQPNESLGCPVGVRWEGPKSASIRVHEPAALGEAFERHYEGLLRLCVLLTRRVDAAEDLAQDAFVRAAPKLSELDDDRVFAYLRATALNLWKNRLRRLDLERRRRLSSRDHEPPPADLIVERDLVWRLVGELPARQRACLVLRFYEDLSETDTAGILRCSVGTVKSQTAKAIAHLRKEMPHED